MEFVNVMWITILVGNAVVLSTVHSSTLPYPRNDINKMEPKLSDAVYTIPKKAPRLIQFSKYSGMDSAQKKQHRNIFNFEPESKKGKEMSLNDLNNDVKQNLANLNTVYSNNKIKIIRHRRAVNPQEHNEANKDNVKVVLENSNLKNDQLGVTAQSNNRRRRKPQTRRRKPKERKVITKSKKKIQHLIKSVVVNSSEPYSAIVDNYRQSKAARFLTNGMEYIPSELLEELELPEESTESNFTFENRGNKKGEGNSEKKGNEKISEEMIKPLPGIEEPKTDFNTTHKLTTFPSSYTASDFLDSDESYSHEESTSSFISTTLNTVELGNDSKPTSLNSNDTYSGGDLPHTNIFTQIRTMQQNIQTPPSLLSYSTQEASPSPKLLSSSITTVSSDETPIGNSRRTNYPHYTNIPKETLLPHATNHPPMPEHRKSAKSNCTNNLLSYLNTALNETTDTNNEKSDYFVMCWVESTITRVYKPNTTKIFSTRYQVTFQGPLYGTASNDISQSNTSGPTGSLLEEKDDNLLKNLQKHVTYNTLKNTPKLTVVEKITKHCGTGSAVETVITDYVSKLSKEKKRRIVINLYPSSKEDYMTAAKEQINNFKEKLGLYNNFQNSHEVAQVDTESEESKAVIALSTSHPIIVGIVNNVALDIQSLVATQLSKMPEQNSESSERKIHAVAESIGTLIEKANLLSKHSSPKNISSEIKKVLSNKLKNIFKRPTRCKKKLNHHKSGSTKQPFKSAKKTRRTETLSQVSVSTTPKYFFNSEELVDLVTKPYESVSEIPTNYRKLTTKHLPTGPLVNTDVLAGKSPPSDRSPLTATQSQTSHSLLDVTSTYEERYESSAELSSKEVPLGGTSIVRTSTESELDTHQQSNSEADAVTKGSNETPGSSDEIHTESSQSFVSTTPANYEDYSVESDGSSTEKKTLYISNAQTPPSTIKSGYLLNVKDDYKMTLEPDKILDTIPEESIDSSSEANLQSSFGVSSGSTISNMQFFDTTDEWSVHHTAKVSSLEGKKGDKSSLILTEEVKFSPNLQTHVEQSNSSSSEEEIHEMLSTVRGSQNTQGYTIVPQEKHITQREESELTTGLNSQPMETRKPEDTTTTILSGMTLFTKAPLETSLNKSEKYYFDGGSTTPQPSQVNELEIISSTENSESAYPTYSSYTEKESLTSTAENVTNHGANFFKASTGDIQVKPLSENSQFSVDYTSTIESETISSLSTHSEDKTGYAITENKIPLQENSKTETEKLESTYETKSDVSSESSTANTYYSGVENDYYETSITKEDTSIENQMSEMSSTSLFSLTTENSFVNTQKETPTPADKATNFQSRRNDPTGLPSYTTQPIQTESIQDVYPTTTTLSLSKDAGVSNLENTVHLTEKSVRSDKKVTYTLQEVTPITLTTITHSIQEQTNQPTIQEHLDISEETLDNTVKIITQKGELLITEKPNSSRELGDSSESDKSTDDSQSTQYPPKENETQNLSEAPVEETAANEQIEGEHTSSYTTIHLGAEMVEEKIQTSEMVSVALVTHAPKSLKKEESGASSSKSSDDNLNDSSIEPTVTTALQTPTAKSESSSTSEQELTEIATNVLHTEEPQNEKYTEKGTIHSEPEFNTVEGEPEENISETDASIADEEMDEDVSNTSEAAERGSTSETSKSTGSSSLGTSGNNAPLVIATTKEDRFLGDDANLLSTVVPHKTILTTRTSEYTTQSPLTAAEAEMTVGARSHTETPNPLDSTLEETSESSYSQGDATEPTEEGNHSTENNGVKTNKGVLDEKFVEASVAEKSKTTDTLVGKTEINTEIPISPSKEPDLLLEGSQPMTTETVTSRFSPEVITESNKTTMQVTPATESYNLFHTESATTSSETSDSSSDSNSSGSIDSSDMSFASSKSFGLEKGETTLTTDTFGGANASFESAESVAGEEMLETTRTVEDKNNNKLISFLESTQKTTDSRMGEWKTEGTLSDSNLPKHENDVTDSPKIWASQTSSPVMDILMVDAAALETEPPFRSSLSSTMTTVSATEQTKDIVNFSPLNTEKSEAATDHSYTSNGLPSNEEADNSALSSTMDSELKLTQEDSTISDSNPTSSQVPPPSYSTSETSSVDDESSGDDYSYTESSVESHSTSEDTLVSPSTTKTNRNDVNTDIKYHGVKTSSPTGIPTMDLEDMSSEETAGTDVELSVSQEDASTIESSRNMHTGKGTTENYPTRRAGTTVLRPPINKVTQNPYETSEESEGSERETYIPETCPECTTNLRSKRLTTDASPTRQAGYMLQGKNSTPATYNKIQISTPHSSDSWRLPGLLTTNNYEATDILKDTTQSNINNLSVNDTSKVKLTSPYSVSEDSLYTTSFQDNASTYHNEMDLSVSTSQQTMPDTALLPRNVHSPTTTKIHAMDIEDAEAVEQATSPSNEFKYETEAKMSSEKPRANAERAMPTQKLSVNKDLLKDSATEASTTEDTTTEELTTEVTTIEYIKVHHIVLETTTRHEYNLLYYMTRFDPQEMREILSSNSTDTQLETPSTTGTVVGRNYKSATILPQSESIPVEQIAPTEILTETGVKKDNTEMEMKNENSKSSFISPHLFPEESSDIISPQPPMSSTQKSTKCGENDRMCLLNDKRIDIDTRIKHSREAGNIEIVSEMDEENDCQNDNIGSLCLPTNTQKKRDLSKSGKENLNPENINCSKKTGEKCTENIEPINTRSLTEKSSLQYSTFNEDIKAKESDATSTSEVKSNETNTQSAHKLGNVASSHPKPTENQRMIPQVDALFEQEHDTSHAERYNHPPKANWRISQSAHDQKSQTEVQVPPFHVSPQSLHYTGRHTVSPIQNYQFPIPSQYQRVPTRQNFYFGKAPYHQNKFPNPQNRPQLPRQEKPASQNSSGFLQFKPLRYQRKKSTTNQNKK